MSFQKIFSGSAGAGVVAVTGADGAGVAVLLLPDGASLLAAAAGVSVFGASVTREGAGFSSRHCASSRSEQTTAPKEAQSVKRREIIIIQGAMRRMNAACKGMLQAGWGWILDSGCSMLDTGLGSMFVRKTGLQPVYVSGLQPETETGS